MTTRILYVRSLPLERDARSTKMVAEYRGRGHQVTPLVWSRGAAPAADGETVTCSVKGGYGRGLSGIGARLAWSAFMARHILRRRHDYDIMHVVDLDTGIIGVPLARLLRKPVVYDAFDHITAIAGGGVLGRLLGKIERWALGCSSIGIFPDPVRLEQYGIGPSEKIRIIGNIPDVDGITTQATSKSGSGALKLVYIGTLEARHRGLEYLPELCERLGDQIEVVVGGTGALHDDFVQAAARLPNLIYLGHQTYAAALRHMLEADCLYGPYLLSAPAHRYASPNKMYEHLALGKPLITNTGTPPGTLVARVRSGFLFDGTFEALIALLAELTREECRAVGHRALAAWQTEFAGLRRRQLARFFDRFDRVATVAHAA